MNTHWLRTMDAEGKSPLDRALASGIRTLADVVLGQEREEEAQQKGETTALHRAARLGLSSAVQTLLHCGADPQAVDSLGETPLHKAVREGALSTVELLVQQCDVNALSANGMTPLHWAAVNGRSDIARVLLTHGGDPWMQSNYVDGLSPVDVAEAMGFTQLVDFLHRKNQPVAV